MAAKMLLLIVVLLVATITIITAAEATPSPAVPDQQSSASADKPINDVNLILKLVFDDIVATAPEGEAMDATAKQLRIAERALAKARAGGDEKVAKLTTAYELKANIVKETPPAEKLERMEELFNAMAAPDHKDCPSGGVEDKPFCETVSKLQRAFNEVRAAVAQGKEEESIDDMFLINEEFGPSIKAINKAYADGDEKEIAAVLATYDKCADAILAAPPADKFKVMQESIEAASSASGKVEQPQMSSSGRSLLEPAKPKAKLDCPSACKVRCGRNWKNEMCMKMCNICCGKCSCVPPGTSQDTRHLCPCYDKMVNPKTGKPKCP